MEYRVARPHKEYTKYIIEFWYLYRIPCGLVGSVLGKDDNILYRNVGSFLPELTV